MKRKTSSAHSSGNPSVVLRAFAPETEFQLSLDGWILLEAMDTALARGERPTSRELVLASLVMTDEDAVFRARRTGKLEELISQATAGKRPADIIGLADRIQQAIAAAFDPADSGADPSEKKSSPAPAGG